jgi:hypothetical protein
MNSIYRINSWAWPRQFGVIGARAERGSILERPPNCAYGGHCQGTTTGVLLDAARTLCIPRILFFLKPLTLPASADRVSVDALRHRLDVINPASAAPRSGCSAVGDPDSAPSAGGCAQRSQLLELLERSRQLKPPETDSGRARNAHATLMTTFPVARPDSEYASASRTCSSGNTVSTSGLIAPLSTSRVISLNCSPSARMNRYS